MDKKPFVHRDKLGKELAVDDCIAYPANNSLYLGVIKRLNPKMLSIKRIDTKRPSEGVLHKYSVDTIKIEKTAEVLMHLLKIS